jgi:hypothetical protein
VGLTAFCPLCEWSTPATSREAARRSLSWRTHIEDHVTYQDRQIERLDSRGLTTCRPCFGAQLANVTHSPCFSPDCSCECSC